MTPYLELMKRALCGLLYNENLCIPQPWEPDAANFSESWEREPGVVARILKVRDFSPGSAAVTKREQGKDWPLFAQTMIGIARLNHLQWCVDRVLTERIPGDFIECGVWRGGASIFMKAMLAEWNDNTRKMWLADSFQGMPDTQEGEYVGLPGGQLAVSVKEVIDNFIRYDLADSRVMLVEGWFCDTLPEFREPLALLRIDADLYDSTMDCLTGLYDQLAPGGFCIVDDYGALETCRQAVEDFRKDRGITDQITRIDWTGVFWRKAH